MAVACEKMIEKVEVRNKLAIFLWRSTIVIVICAKYSNYSSVLCTTGGIKLGNSIEASKYCLQRSFLFGGL